MICYGQLSGLSSVDGYNVHGHLLHKTDASGIVTTYGYDALNRLTAKTAPGINYVYEYDSAPSIYNGIGRLTYASNSVDADKKISYDAMGRPNWQASWTPSSPNHTGIVTTAQYNLAGNLAQLKYPDGRTVVQNFDGAGRLGSVTSGTITSPGPAYLSSITYNFDGSPNVQTFGNNVQQTTTENNRLQVQSMVVASTSGVSLFFSHTYCYSGCATGGSANNGNIWGITDTLNPAKTQGFTYDSLNRISNFSIGGVASQQYTIDSFGNMSRLSGSTALTTFNASTNRINNLPCSTSTAPFDSAGNQLCDTDTYGGVRQYQYDAASRIKQIASLGSSTPFETYIYDANGARIRKTNADGTFTEYVNFGGMTLAEKDQTGSWSDYIYANGKKIARADSYDQRIHLHGTQCSSCGWQSAGWYLPFSGYTVQSGDKISWRQYQNGTGIGGLTLSFNNGSNTN